MIETSRLYRMVRTFALTEPVWSGDRQTYFTKPDEYFDPTLISRRVYGTPDEYLVIIAAAGIDRITTQKLTERELVLPTSAKLSAMKSALGIATVMTSVR
jgi:hypothetical protein